MNRDEFIKCKKHLLDKANKVMTAKETEYFSTDDVLANLKRIAAFRDKETPETIINLVSKQLVSISDMVNNEPMMLDPIPLDVWEEKIVDSLNYIFKFYASLRERKSND
jgi:DUF438 domain-containing protein